MWLELLRQAVADSSQAAVSRATGLSPTAISLALAGKYPAKTDKVADKVMLRYGRVACPFLQQEITFATCREHHGRAAPTSSPFAMRHWRACQGCPHNTMRRAA